MFLGDEDNEYDGDDDLCCELKTVRCRNDAIGVSAIRKHRTSPDKFSISVLSGDSVR